ncbi:LPS assembly protein LptD [Hellea sp.]|nr:LPS assembly protein LptD [Hellea sp.]
MYKSVFKSSLWLSACALPLFCAAPASAQFTQGEDANRTLKLKADSPFRDPDIIYLEADELINDEIANVITASGEVEGRYQDRTLRADRVVYNLTTGLVIASGNVVLIDANGSTQYAEKLELSNELEAGTAADFTARQPNGGIMAAAFATRTEDGEIELYNAYYTACKPCIENGKAKRPSWRLKARKVRQDKDTRTVRYNDATFEFLGVPLFYTPYLSHPDPSAGRSSGLLIPFAGLSSSKGLNLRVPYYWAIDDYTEATFTPHFFQRVNPLLGYQFARRFNTGVLDIEGSVTYASFFDRDGDTFQVEDFADPTQFPGGKKLRSHIYAKGLFAPNETWTYGYGVQLSTDDNYLNRYDQDETPERFGLYESESRRNISQAFVVGQDDSFRLATSSFGFQDLRTSFRENTNEDSADFGLITVRAPNDRELPIIAPKIELEKYWSDPVVGGRIKAFGDFTALTRNLGTDYIRGTAGVDYSKTFIAPGGIEVKPFGNVRYDRYDITPDNDLENDDEDNTAVFEDVSFGRTVGQVGVDVRYPFIKSSGGIDWIIEPRAQVTQSYGDGKLENFSSTDSEGNTISTFQDSINVDFDQALFWQTNKATGYDFWQEGLRADIGASFIADAGKTRAHLFVGQSYISDRDGNFALGSGLSQSKSDVVGLFELDINDKFSWTTRLRYDDDSDAFRRIDSGFSYRSERLSTSWRYFRLDSATNDANLLNLTNDGLLDFDPEAPPEEIRGSVRLKLTDKWSVSYNANRDLDRDITRRQGIGLKYQDDCTLVEFLYTRSNFDSEVIRDTNGFGIRVSLLTLGDFSPE